MLEAVDLSKKISKQEYRGQVRGMQRRLFQLQRACRKAGVATIVVFEGWDAAGKGTAINKLTQRLEPRAFSLHAVREPRTFETHLPWMWRFWAKLPNWGEMAVFDRSWYGRVLVERVDCALDEAIWSRAYEDIVRFERALADDRYLLVKFFLHISRDQQKRRFKTLESDPATSWQVESEDWKRHRKYKEYLSASEEMLKRTDSEWGPWTLVAAADHRWVRVKMFDTLIRSMERGLAHHGHPIPDEDE